MDVNDIGSIIAAARKKKYLTQDGLAKQLHITRQAISNWETNKALPDVSIILSLCRVLELNFNDLIGVANNDIKALDVINYEKKKMTKKTFFIITIISIFFLLICITIYMILNKNAFAVYDVYLDSNDFSLTNAILVKSKINNYFKLGTLKTNLEDIPEDTVYNIKLYIIRDGKEKAIAESEYKDNISITEKYGYNEYFSSDIYGDEDLYLDIEYTIKDELYKFTFPLNLKLNFESNRLFYTQDKDIKEQKSNIDIEVDKLYVDDLINAGYKYDEKNDYYIRKIKNGKYVYYSNSTSIEYTYEDNKSLIDVLYYFDDKHFEVNEYDYEEKKIVNKFKIDDKKTTCMIDKCGDYQKYTSIIYEEVNRILN